MKILCFTSFTFSYLNRARVLARSVRRHHPDWELVALIVDLPPPAAEIDLGEDFDRIVHIAQLGLDAAWLFKHDALEACTAVKGPFLLQACAGGAEAVIYLDADVALLDRLDPVIQALADHDIVLTPHLLDPEDSHAAIQDNEIAALRHGIYNLGFIAVRTSGEGARFAQWWSDRLTAYGYDDIPNGLYGDQRWCDHVPAMFERVRIHRDPGLNIANWNLSRRTIRIDRQGRVWANAAPARFWHFTKMGPVARAQTERYAGRNFEVCEIWNWYMREVEAASEPGIPEGYWAYGAFADGKPIERAHRLMYRQSEELREAFPDPFASGRGSYQAWLADQGGARAEPEGPAMPGPAWRAPSWTAPARPSPAPDASRLEDNAGADAGLEVQASLAKAQIARRRARRDAVAAGERASIFTDIWSRNLWASEESRSGPGSAVERTAPLRESLARFVEENRIGFIYDAPCGDFNWMRMMSLPSGVRYLGVDIVEPLIERNRALYGGPTVDFAVGDIVRRAPAAEADLWLCRHALFHLTGAEGVAVIHRWRGSAVRWFLATTTPSITHNLEAFTGGWRPINLEKPPYDLGPPVAYLPDQDPDDPDMMLGAWRL